MGATMTAMTGVTASGGNAALVSVRATGLAPADDSTASSRGFCPWKRHIPAVNPWIGGRTGVSSGSG